jgi:predicted GNAT family acetyltransferase
MTQLRSRIARQMPQVAIADVPDESRYVVDVDGRRVGFVTYRLGDGQIALLHAETEPSMRDQGIASRLIEFTLDDARARGLSVLPYCPFVRYYIDQHDEYLALVPLDAQARFGL